jgi:nucleoside-triphosphatase THEP1
MDMSKMCSLQATTVLQIRVAQANKERKVCLLFYVLSPHKISLPNQDFIKDKLANHVTTKHEYTDQSKTFCAPHTRVEIQQEIEEWLSPQPSNSERIFWITGIAGSGKSTLSATVAETLRKNHTPVAAQFFISRNIPETIDPNKIIPTIAKQLSEFSTAAARVTHDTLKNDGFPSSREEQVKALLLAPIQEICKSHDRVVILIDALDELQNAAKSVLEILSIIAPKGCDLPDNIRFVITSRPEHWADISKSKTLELSVFKQHSLLTDSSVQEVHDFIVARMPAITPDGWDDWPTHEQLLTLSEKANGLFHYAATVLQWIEEQIRQDGKASRKQVFEKFAQLGIGQLEDLYRLILTSFKNIDSPGQDMDRHVNQLRGFRHVIGTILVLEDPLTIRQITALLADISEDDFDVANFLKQFRSVLIPGTTTSFEEATPQMHKSFRDYITGAHSPKEFHISIGHAHFVTARSCLEVIVKAGSEYNPEQQYSIWHWSQHFRKAVEEGMGCEDETMWNLLEQMAGNAAINIGGPDSWSVFLDMATVGWRLLEVRTKHGRKSQVNNDVPETY